MKVRYGLTILSALLISVVPVAQATKLFAVNAEYDIGSVTETIRVEDSSFPDLIGDLINGKGGFSELSGKDVYAADVQFFGVAQVLRIQTKVNDSDLYEVTLTSALIGDINVTLTAVDKADLRTQIVNWIYLDAGPDALRLLEAVAIASTAAVSDGTPGATTAQIADTSFGLFGFYQRTSTDRNQRGFESGAFLGLDLRSNAFETDTPVGDMSGDRLDLAVPLWLHFNSRVSYVGQININRTTIEGTDFYGFGADLGFAFRPAIRIDDDIFGWSIAPFFGGKAMGSVDGVTAAILYDYGINNRFEWRLMERGLISWVFQLSKFDNLTINIDEYNLNAEVDQTIMKNGIMLELPMFSSNRLNANFVLVDTRFLEEANTSNYQTLGLGLGYNHDTFSLQANVGTDLSSDYQTLKLNLGCSWDL